MNTNSIRGRMLASTVLGGLMLMGATPAFAQTTSSEAASASEVGEVVITGSRIKRAETATAAPVAVVDAQTFVDRGYVSAGQMLNSITSNVPSAPQAAGSGSAAGNGQTFANLFNLGAGRTLTLVNGRRFVTSSSGVFSASAAGQGDRVVDTDIIPVGLIKRVDIVQAGGAAVYGTDAIAGVVNYVLRDNFEGLELDAQYGISSRDDYPVSSARATFGRNFLDGRANLAADVEWSKTRPLLDYDRPRSNLARVSVSNPANTSATDGIPSVRENLNTRFTTFNYNGIISTAGPPFASSIFKIGGVTQQLNAAGNAFTPYNTGTIYNPTAPPFSSGGDGLPYQELASLYTGVERWNATLLGHYDITEHIKLSGQVLYARTESRDPYANLASYTVLNSAASGAGAIPIARTNPYLTPALTAALGPGGPPLFLSKAFSDLLPTREGTFRNNTFQATLGLDGDFDLGDRNFYWSLSASHAETDGAQRGYAVWTSRFNNAVNAVRNGAGQIVCAINADATTANDDAGCAPINPFGIGNVSQEARLYVNLPVGQDYLNTQDDYLATLGGDLIALPAGKMKFSVAYEHRREEAKYVPLLANQLGLTGSQVPSAATHGQFHTDELSGEVLVPVLGGDFTLPFAQMVELTGAYRYVDNSIAGKEDVWAVGGRWEVVKGLTFRISRSRNFRAPTLDQIFAPSRTVLSNSGFDPCDADRIASGINPAVRLANCQKLFAANPGYGPLATFQDPSENFNQALVTTGGNSNLRNEISKTFTWGVVLQPAFIPGLTIVADRIEVDLKDGLSAFLPADFQAACYDNAVQPLDICSTFTRNATGAIATANQTTFNAGRDTFRGEVYNITYTFPISRFLPETELGEIELSADATHTTRRERSVTGADITRYDGTAATPTGQPDWAVQFNAIYRVDGFRLTYQMIYLPEVKQTYTDTIESTPTPVIPSNTRHNISFAYDWKNYTLRAGIINLTDEQPSFPTRNYGDILGRQYFMGLRARF